MNWMFIFPLLLMVIFSVLIHKKIERMDFNKELAFSSVLAGLFLGLVFWIFSMIFLSEPIFYVVGGAIVGTAIKSITIHLRKDRRYSIFFGLGFGAAIPALSLLYADFTVNIAIYGILFSLASLLFHSSTSVKLSYGNIWKAIFLVFLLTIPYNFLFYYSYTGYIIMIISVFYSAIIFRRYLSLLT